MGGTASSTPDAQTSGVSNSARRDGSFMATAASVPRQETVQSCNNDSLRSSQRGIEFTALDEEGNYCVENESQRRRSTHTPSQMQQVNPNERLRPSTLRRQSFLVEFSKTKGPPQIAFLMMLVAIGAGSTIGVVPAVMTDRFARMRHGYEGTVNCHDILDATLKPEACLLGSADAQTAVATSNLLSNALTFITSSLLGSISDEYGRKPILIAGLAVGTIPSFLLWLMQVRQTLSPWWYYGMHAFSGSINWVAVAMSALADVLPQQFRAPGIGLLMAGFMLGFSLAPILSIFLQPKPLSFVAFLIVFLGLISTVMFVPETLPPAIAREAREREQRRQENARIELTQYSTIQAFAMQIYNVISRPFREMAILNRNQFFRLISSLAFFSGIVSSGDQILLVYYLEERLGFTMADVSKMFVILGCMGLIAQGFLLKPLNDCLGEKNVVAFAFLCGAIDNAMYGLARNKTTIFVALGVAGLTGMAFPTISAIKANNVDESEQGRIQGALYSLQALASGLGPVSLKFVYSKTKDSTLGPGSMFLFASCLYLIAVCIACYLPKDKANAHGRNGTGMINGDSNQDLEEYLQLASNSSSDEDDYGTMEEARR